MERKALHLHLEAAFLQGGRPAVEELTKELNEMLDGQFGTQRNSCAMAWLMKQLLTAEQQRGSKTFAQRQEEARSRAASRKRNRECI